MSAAIAIIALAVAVTVLRFFFFRNRDDAVATPAFLLFLLSLLQLRFYCTVLFTATFSIFQPFGPLVLVLAPMCWPRVSTRRKMKSGSRRQERKSEAAGVLEF